MQNELIKKLDLEGFLGEFNALLARQKPPFLEGDTKLHFERIKELEGFEFTPPPPCANLVQNLTHLSKQGILHLAEIYEFVKIFAYFNYLKTLKFEGAMRAWLDKIIIPLNLSEICDKFDEKGELKDSVDDRILGLNEALRFKKALIHDEFRTLITSKALQTHLIDTQIHFINGCECLLVRGGHDVRSRIISRSSGGGFYIVPQIVEKWQDECEKIRTDKEKIYFEYAKAFSTLFFRELLFLKFIDRAFDLIDNYAARVLLARRGDLEFVLNDGSKDIILKDFAHPALKNAKSVSLNFTKQVLLITGVNAGGKTMLLKGILAAVFLSKCLLPMHIKANESKIGRFSGLTAIIDDPQSVKNDISTFAGRMLGFSTLLGKRDILLGVDEIELGTDFEEAAALYAVLVKALMARNAKIIITTHHKRLAMHLAKENGVDLLAALFDEKAARPRYEFLQGTVGKSYAFETALRYGISANLVGEARKIYGENEQNLEELVGKNINLQMRLNEELKAAQSAKTRAQELINSLKNQKEKNDAELKKTLERLENEYLAAINEAKKGVNLSDIKDKQRAINRAAALKKQVKMPEFSQSEPLKIGDFVKYNSLKGEIIAINKNEATIESDGITLRVALNLLKKSVNLGENKKSAVVLEKPTNARLSLDLHGMRADEAIEELDKFISDALMAGLDEVLINHGIGTGRLAKIVREFLQSHKSVKSFADAPAHQGGYGVKVVRF